VPFAETDLIDGDLRELMELGTGKTLQVLDAFDDIPVHPRVPGCILDGHVIRSVLAWGP
jgi:hypothetical protein